MHLRGATLFEKQAVLANLQLRCGHQLKPTPVGHTPRSRKKIKTIQRLAGDKQLGK